VSGEPGEERSRAAEIAYNASLGTAIPPEIHRERHFPEAEVRAALETAGLGCLDVYGHHHDAIPKQPLDEIADTKGVYIARAAGA